MVDQEIEGRKRQGFFPVLIELIIAAIRLVWPVSQARRETDSGRRDGMVGRKSSVGLFPRPLPPAPGGRAGTGFKNRARPLKSPRSFSLNPYTLLAF